MRRRGFAKEIPFWSTCARRHRGSPLSTTDQWLIAATLFWGGEMRTNAIRMLRYSASSFVARASVPLASPALVSAFVWPTYSAAFCNARRAESKSSSPMHILPRVKASFSRYAASEPAPCCFFPLPAARRPASKTRKLNNLARTSNLICGLVCGDAPGMSRPARMQRFHRSLPWCSRSLAMRLGTAGLPCRERPSTVWM